MIHTYLPPSRSGDPFTVGFYDPSGKWVALQDFCDETDAAFHVHFLNGGTAVRDVGFYPPAQSSFECPCGRGETPCPGPDGRPLCARDDAENPCKTHDAEGLPIMSALTAGERS